MKEFIKKMLTGVDGNPSSKRVITMISFILISIAFVSNIFFDIPLKEYVWTGMVLFTGSGLGFTTLDHFKLKKGE